MTMFQKLGRIPVWPYFFLSLLAAALGIVFLAIWLPDDYPAEGDLKKVSGEVKTVAIRNEISNNLRKLLRNVAEPDPAELTSEEEADRG